MTRTQIEFEAVIENDIRIHLPEQSINIELQTFRIRAQNIYAPPQLILSIQPQATEIPKLKLDPGHLDQGWLHYQMKPELLDVHPELFEMEDQDHYFQAHLSFLGDLNHYKILPAGALASS